MKRSIVGRPLFAAALCLLAVSTVRADNWPQWRGANHDGISHETNVPSEWSETKNLLWKLPLPGMGGSTPAVWGDRIFLTSEDKGNVVVLCISTSGKEIWRRKLGTSARIERTDEGNGASASPSTDGTHVWAFAGSGELACFDFDGKEVWKINLQKYGVFKSNFGVHSTPLLHGDRLYLQLLHDNSAAVIALDKLTGKEVWKIDRKSDGVGENKHSYASPCLWQKGTQAYLIVHGNDYATAHRLEDGSEIWRVGGLNPKEKYKNDLRYVASPVATPDLIVIPTSKNGPVVGLKPDATGLVLSGSASEQWRRSSNTPDVPSPLVVDGLVYLCRESGGTLICLDAVTGKENYMQRIHDSRYRGSPLFADGKVYLTARDGVVTVVKAGPTFQVLATNTLSDQISASPAVADGRIYLRGFKSLYAIGTK